MICFLATILQLAALIIGLKLSFLQWLLLEVSIIDIKEYLSLHHNNIQISLFIITVSSLLRLAWSGKSLSTRIRQHETQCITTSGGTFDRKVNLLAIPRPAVKTKRESEDLKALYANASWTTEPKSVELLVMNDGKISAMMLISVLKLTPIGPHRQHLTLS